MLTITQRASDAMRGVLESQNAPEGSVIRIGPAPESSNLMVSVTESPEPDDQIVKGDDIEVSVERSTVEMLDDKELDAMVEGSEVRFSIAQQAGAGAEDERPGT